MTLHIWYSTLMTEYGDIIIKYIFFNFCLTNINACSVFLELIGCVLVKPEVIPGGQVSMQIVFTCPRLNTDISPTPWVAIVCPSLGGVTLPKRGTLAGELVRHDWATEVQLLKHSVIQLSYL